MIYALSVVKTTLFFDLMLAAANIKAGRLYRSFNHTGSYYDGRTIARARGAVGFVLTLEGDYMNTIRINQMK